MSGVCTVPERIDRILGLVRYCARCGEWWPRDAEFWYFDRDGKVMSYCRACWADRREAMKARAS